MKSSLLHRSLQLILIVSFVISTQNVHAWGLTGHRVIAEIAQQHLSPKAKRELAKLMGKESLAYWANWMDFIKSDSSWDKVSAWHYVNLPGNMGRDSFIRSLQQLSGENLYTQIKLLSLQLRDQSLSIEQRQIALRFLIHLVGDLHQPLHVGRADDLGGNRITVYWFERKMNLHSLWDSGLIDFQQYSYTEYANLLNIASKARVKELQASSLEDWFYESHVLANKVYASAAPEAKLSYRYNFLFQNDLEQQLLKGGVRLAKVLNEAFK